MSELRTDYLTEETVIISSERRNRPNTFENSDLCPFCLEQEYMVPTVSYKSEDSRVRVFENKYPIFYPTENGVYGVHQVLVDTNIHTEKLNEFEPEDILKVFKGVKFSLDSLCKDEKIKYVQVFKNEKEKAGASIEHSHWQIAASSFIPKKQAIISKNSKLYYDENNSCYFCDLIKNLETVIIENNTFIAFTPEFSKFNFQIRIVSKRHNSDFKDFDTEELLQLSEILHKSLNAIKYIHTDVCYNICMYNSVYNDAKYDYKNILHFHMDIIPRLGNMAGYEFSTDTYINPIFPEEATEILKKFL